MVLYFKIIGRALIIEFVTVLQPTSVPPNATSLGLRHQNVTIGVLYY